MASFHYLKQTKPRVDSPAKIFAKLKSKVQREGTCTKDGASTGSEPLCSVREKLGAVFKSPSKRAESTCITDDLKERQRFGSYRHEAQALTLSPISSPQKTFGYLNISNKPVEEVPRVTDTGHGWTPRKGAFLESTAVSHLLPLRNRTQIHTEPPQVRDLGVFKVSSRTPVKTQPAEKDCVRSVFEEDRAPQDALVSPAYMVSPMRKRLRKRKWESQEFNKVSSTIKEGNRKASERKTSCTFSEDDTHDNTRMEGLGDVREQRVPADLPQMNQFTHEATLPQRSIPMKRCCVITDKILPMSPAKMFAYMKERESKAEQQEVHKANSSMRNLFDRGNFHQSKDTHPSTAHSLGEMQDSRSAPESSDSQSDVDPSEDVLIPAVSSQQVLLEDPLVLNTPRISIPKKHETVFKRGTQAAKFPSDSVIYLKKWFLRKNHSGLFVDGIHQDENIPWNSNIIMERVSSSVLKTVSGRVYILVGKMNLDVDSGFPKWFLKKFVKGFPPNWKALYEKFLSESRGETVRNSERSRIAAKTKSEASSITLSEKRQRQKLIKTSDSCPPSSSSSAQVSRSGRVIKPPLEYWKGGRVILDAHMNVTIHECYETSICIPEVTTTVSTRKPASVFLPTWSEGREQRQPASNQEASVPVRKVKAPLRKGNRAKVNHDKKPSYSPEPPVETLSSPDGWSGRTTRSSQRHPATERTFNVDTVPQNQSEPKKSSTQRSKKQTHDTTRPSLRTLRSKRAVSASSQSLSGSDKKQSSDDEFSSRRKKREKQADRKRGGKVLNKSRPSRVLPSSPSAESSEESGKEMNKRTRAKKNSEAAQAQQKQSKSTKLSPPTKPLPKLTQSSKKHKANKGNAPAPREQDEDEWTELELKKLREAVSYYPKHMASYWVKVASMVGTRSAEECYSKHTSQGPSQTPAKKPNKSKKEKEKEAPKDSDHPVISARAGTLKRKQQVRQFLEAMPREDVEDAFSSAYMQTKRFEMPSMCPSDDHDFALSDLEPLTPVSPAFPEVKTPQCLHITPGMMGSPNRSNDDKYVFQLQKRMKKKQFNVCKQAPSSKTFSPTPSVKRTMRRCGNTENDTLVVWEMFPGKDEVLSDSGEDEDFYFSDDD